MAKKNSNMILVAVLLLFILMVIINKSVKESYVAAPRARARARVRADARTYTGPGDALRGPVAPARRARRRVVWYNPVTWRWLL